MSEEWEGNEMQYAHIELRVKAEMVVAALRDYGGYPGVVRLEQVDLDDDIIWAGDDSDDPQDHVILHITRDRGETDD